MISSSANEERDREKISRQVLYPLSPAPRGNGTTAQRAMAVLPCLPRDQSLRLTDLIRSIHSHLLTGWGPDKGRRKECTTASLGTIGIRSSRRSAVRQVRGLPW